MRIQIINSTLGGDFSAEDIGITYLATYLNERTDHEAGILDITFRRRNWREYLKSEIMKFQPDMLGVSSHFYMEHAKKVMGEIKSKYDIPIVVGGHHVSTHPEDVINIPEVDAICIGDGEYAITEFLDRKEKGISAEGIKGIWAKENGRVIKNQRGYFIKDIDSLPIPNWDLWKDLDKYFYYLGMLYIIGNRGCPYHCSYCDAHGIAKSLDGPFVRFRDPVKYAQEIAHHWNKYKKRGLRLAQLFDPVFTMNEKWLKAFCDEYIAQGVADEFPFSAFSRLDHINENKANMLAKAGCALLRVGVEAGDQYIRNEVYEKNLTDTEIREAFKVCKNHGIGFTAFYILGGPAETKETLQKTLDLAIELDGNRSAFFIFKPFTEDSIKLIEKFGGYVDKQRIAKADNITFDAVIGSINLKPQEVEWFQKKAYVLTAGRRLIKMILRQKHRYPIYLGKYMLKGLMDGLDPRYLTLYYHIYGYDNVHQ